MTSDAVVLSVLGPVEARRGGTRLTLGGVKQRTVLATLLVRAGEAVSTHALVDEVWGDDPPPSAGHGLEAYVSRLRRLFEPHELTLARVGTGYVLELRSAVLDTMELQRLAADAEEAADEEDSARASAAATAALDLWRGEPLADLCGGDIGRAEAARLDDIRMRMLQLRFEAELALGRHTEVVAELQGAVARHPYREHLVGLLMLALYRCGRQTDALAAYEAARRRLDAELGLRPGTELQQLSARIVRQEPQLAAPSPARRSENGALPERRARRAMRFALAVAVAVLVVAASGSAQQPLGPTSRVAVVLPARPAAAAFEESEVNNRAVWTASGIQAAAERHGLELERLSVEERSPAQADIARLLRRIDEDRLDLVVLTGDRAAAHLVAPYVADHPATTFVFVDASLADLALDGVPNAVGLRFAYEHPALLAGTAGAMMVARSAPPDRGRNAFSVVAAVRDVETRNVVAAFRRGVHQVFPRARVRVDYAGQTFDPTPCETLANEQLDAGAQVVLVVAGPCGLGAAAVVRARSAWLAGEDEYGVSDVRPWVVASMFKDWNDGLGRMLDIYAAGGLPAGSDIVLGLHDSYATGMTMSDAVPAAIQSDVIELCTRVREEAARAAA